MSLSRLISRGKILFDNFTSFGGINSPLLFRFVKRSETKRQGLIKMRDLQFRNITSPAKGQRVLACSELSEQEGIRTTVNRHLVCRVFEAEGASKALPQPHLYVFKKQDKKNRMEIFYCRIKGSMYFSFENRLCLVSFINSLKIQLRAVV